MHRNLLENVHYQFSSLQTLQEQYITPKDRRYLKQLRIPVEKIELNSKSLKLASNRSKILFLMIFQALYQSDLMIKQKNLLYEKKLEKKIQNRKSIQNERKGILSQQRKRLFQKQRKIIQLQKEQKFRLSIFKNHIITQGRKIHSLQEKVQRYQKSHQQKFSQLQQSFETQKQEIRKSLVDVNQEIQGVKGDVRNVAASLVSVVLELRNIATINSDTAKFCQGIRRMNARNNPQQNQKIRTQDGRQNITNNQFSEISENSNQAPSEFHIQENSVFRTAPSQRR